MCKKENISISLQHKNKKNNANKSAIMQILHNTPYLQTQSAAKRLKVNLVSCTNGSRLNKHYEYVDYGEFINKQ